jgi:aerobic carbon-monoxide dehydrogenase medium subunit
LKAPDFAYAKPATLAEAFDLLARPGAKALAGGQSLIPSLNMRLSAPELLVDISGLPGLSGISTEGSSVRVGALTTHAQIQTSDFIAKKVPLMAKAVPHVAHAAIRNRGTLGGSLANADPAAEYPACAVALEAVIRIAGKGGERQVKAADFFKDLFETDLKAGELVTAVDFPAAKPGDRSAFVELARRHGDYAIVGLAVQNRRFVFFGVGSTPVAFSFDGGLDKAKAALAATLKPAADLTHSPAAKLHLAGVLLERAWNA